MVVIGGGADFLSATVDRPRCGRKLLFGETPNLINLIAEILFPRAGM